MSGKKIISFEEFRLKKESNDSSLNAITQVLKKDLREQEDLIDWYLFHNSINRYKFYLPPCSIIITREEKVLIQTLVLLLYWIINKPNQL